MGLEHLLQRDVLVIAREGLLISFTELWLIFSDFNMVFVFKEFDEL